MPRATDANAGASGGARILDAGYRRYEGSRAGLAHSVRSVIANTLRRVLGLRRPARSKILPVASILFAYLPAMVFVGIAALLNRFGEEAGETPDIIPDYPDYYGYIMSAILLFIVFVAPEAVCPDRRSRVLSLYLSSPLTRMTYLGAKAAAIATVIAVVTVGPPLLLLFGLALQGDGPSGIGGFFGVLGRILLSGAILAALFTAVTLAIAALTDRRAIAAAATLLVVLGTHIVAGTIHFGLGGSESFALLSLLIAPFELISRIYGATGELASLSTGAITASVLAWTVAGTLVAAIRYQRLQVTR